MVDDVRSATSGDVEAWDRIVHRFAGLVWAVVRGHRLSAEDAADVAQTTWLRLVEHLGRLRDPERLGVWLATTARHECLRTLRRTARLVPADIDPDGLADCHAPEAEGRLLAQERDAELWRAFESLPTDCQNLLRVLMAVPAPSYAEVSAALGMPVGSIGPRRARCLQRLRTRAQFAPLPAPGREVKA